MLPVVAASTGADLPADTLEPTPQLPVWSSADIGGATPYADTTIGLLYRGFARSTPAAQQARDATAAPERLPALAATKADQPAALPIGLEAGLLLCVLGAAVAVYDHLRSRRTRPPSEPTSADATD
jgi:hypothetical protein